MYSVMVKIDESLPWIELKGEYQTRREAKKAAEQFINTLKIKIVEIQEKRKLVKQLAAIKA